MVIIDECKTASSEPSWLSESDFSYYSTTKWKCSEYEEQTREEELNPNDADFCHHQYDLLVASDTRSSSKTSLDDSTNLSPVTTVHTSQIVEPDYNLYPSHFSKSECRNFIDQQKLLQNESFLPELSYHDVSKRNLKSSLTFNFSCKVLEKTKTARTPFMVDLNNRYEHISCNRKISGKTSQRIGNPWTRGLRQRSRFAEKGKLSDDNLEYLPTCKIIGEKEVESKTNPWVRDVSHKTRFVNDTPSDFYFKGSSRKHPGTLRTRGKNAKVGLQGSSPAWDFGLKASTCKRYTMMGNKMKVTKPDGSNISIMDRWLKARCEQFERERAVDALALRMGAVE